MKRAYLVEWKSHGIYPTTQRVVAGDAREAAQWAPQHNIEATGIVVEASGERVPDDLWRSFSPEPRRRQGPISLHVPRDIPVRGDHGSGIDYTKLKRT